MQTCAPCEASAKPHTSIWDFEQALYPPDKPAKINKTLLAKQNITYRKNAKVIARSKGKFSTAKLQSMRNANAALKSRMNKKETL